MDLTLIDFYDKLSKNYLELYGEEQKEKWKKIREFLSKKKEILKNKTIVDLGCGIGFTEFLVDFKIRKIGIDISFESLKLAKNKYDLVINMDINNLKICEKKLSELFLISVSSLQNLKEKSIKKILKYKCFQLHSVMYRGKGEEYWKELFEHFGYKFLFKVKNDIVFCNF